MLGELVPLALVVALSPVSIIPAVVLVLHTDHPKPTGLAFMTGWLVGLAVLTAVFVQVPHLIDGLGRESPTWAPVLRIAVGVLLITDRFTILSSYLQALTPEFLLRRL